MVTSPYDEIADKYQSAFTSPLDLGEDHALTRIIKHHIPSGPCIDLGCGTAAVGKYLNHHKYTGLDISSEMLKLAKSSSTNSCRFVESDMCSTPFKTGQFPASFTIYGAICEVPAYTDALSEIRRITARDGVVIVMLLSPRYQRKQTFLKRQKVNILTRYRPFKYEKCVLESYFTVVEGYGFSWLPNIVKPPPQTPPMLVSRYLQWESKTLGHIWPDMCLYYIFVCKNDLHTNKSKGAVRCHEEALD